MTAPPEALAEVEEYYLARLFRDNPAPVELAPNLPDIVIWDGPAPISRRSGDT